VEEYAYNATKAPPWGDSNNPYWVTSIYRFSNHMCILAADFVDKKGRVETDLKLLRLEPPLPFLMRRRDIRQYLFLNISERLEVQT
jgi:hypothetical protein